MPPTTDLIKGYEAGKATALGELLQRYLCLHPWTALSFSQGSISLQRVVVKQTPVLRSDSSAL